MALRVTRPAFIEAMQRRGVDVSRATRQEMRAYVCGQCHVEYYFRGAEEKYLVFPWDRGMKIENIEAYYDEIKFADFEHKITKAAMLKMQHPDFELWSTGNHARSGVMCADCHMPYRRVGAVKISDHWVRTPLANIQNTCMTCHRQTEAELRARVLEAQARTYQLLTQAEEAIADAIRAIEQAMTEGVPDDALAEARALHRKAQMRWDFISAENSMGFHSPQEAVRILGDAIDYARRAELAAVKAPRPK
jgi:nitrite reductase (cytochrome c-552)